MIVPRRTTVMMILSTENLSHHILKPSSLIPNLAAKLTTMITYKRNMMRDC